MKRYGIWIGAIVAIVVVYVAIAYLNFFYKTDSSIVEFNNFPSELIKSTDTTIIEIEISELLQNAVFSAEKIEVNEGWVTIGIVDGLVSKVDPSPRPSNPMKCFTFEFPGKEGLYEASGLIETRVESGFIKISFNERYLASPMYSVVARGDEYKYGKIKLAIHHHDSYQNHGNPPNELDSSTSKAKTQSQKNGSPDKVENWLQKNARELNEKSEERRENKRLDEQKRKKNLRKHRESDKELVEEMLAVLETASQEEQKTRAKIPAPFSSNAKIQTDGFNAGDLLEPAPYGEKAKPLKKIE